MSPARTIMGSPPIGRWVERQTDAPASVRHRRTQARRAVGRPRIRGRAAPDRVPTRSRAVTFPGEGDMTTTLDETARAIVADGKGVLAADETPHTLTKRMTALG